MIAAALGLSNAHIVCLAASFTRNDIFIRFHHRDGSLAFDAVPDIPLLPRPATHGGSHNNYRKISLQTLYFSDFRHSQRSPLASIISTDDII